MHSDTGTQLSLSSLSTHLASSMALKQHRSSPLDNPPAKEEEASSEELSESDSKVPELSKKKTQPKKPDSAAKSQSPSSSEYVTASESDWGAVANGRVVHAAPNAKPIASGNMEELRPPPKINKSKSKHSTSQATVKTENKQSGGYDRELVQESKKVKRKRNEEEQTKKKKKAKKKKNGDDQQTDGGEECKKAKLFETDGGGECKKPKLFERVWSHEDELIMLKRMDEYTIIFGVEPTADLNAFFEFVKDSVEWNGTKTQLQDKIRRMKKKYENILNKRYKPGSAHDLAAFELSKKVWGGGEDLEGKGLSDENCNKKNLASLVAGLLASSEILNEHIPFDKGLKELGLSETCIMQGMELIGASKRAEMEDEWKKLLVPELELFVKRSELERKRIELMRKRAKLARDQAKLILEALKSSDH